MPPNFYAGDGGERVTVDELLRAAAARLERSGDLDAGADARWLLCGCLGCNSSWLRFSAPPDEAGQARYWAMVERRAAGEPLQYILGDQPFCGRSFRTDARALIPRPETEELCLKALELARENAQALGARVELCLGDLYAPVSGRAFDMIVSNPPYLGACDMAQLQREVRREPALALFGGEDGLDVYRRLAQGAATMLKPGGHIALEVGAGQAGDVCALLGPEFEDKGICRDINGVERIVYARRAG